MAVAEAIRSGFAHEILQGPQGGFRGTVSAGLSMGEDGSDSFDDFFRRADDALYAAKNGGRNRVTASTRE
jgi:PleD family two-component response regulator